MTLPGTSLLGLVKHLAGAEYRWFCDTFGRDREPLPFNLDEDIEADMRPAPGGAGDAYGYGDAQLLCGAFGRR